MYVILAYDVEQKKTGKVLKTCRKYLTHVQKSLFEGQITEGKLKKLKNELSRILNTDTDSCIIYTMESTRYCQKQILGKSIFRPEDILILDSQEHK